MLRLVCKINVGESTCLTGVKEITGFRWCGGCARGYKRNLGHLMGEAIKIRLQYFPKSFPPSVNNDGSLVGLSMDGIIPCFIVDALNLHINY